MTTKTPKDTILESFETEEAAEKALMEKMEEVRGTIEEGKGNSKAVVYNSKGEKLGTLADQTDWEAFDDYDGLGPTKKIKGKDMFAVPGKLFTHIEKAKGEKTVYVQV